MTSMTATLTPEQAKEVHAAAQTAWAEMKSVLETSEAERTRLGEELAETKQTLERVEKELEDRLDQLETRGNRLDVGGDDPRVQEIAKEALLAFVRKGEAGLAAKPEFEKALATDSDADGGILLPENVAPGILEKLVEISPVRSLVNIETISKGNSFKIPVEGDAFAVGWVSERGSRPETSAGTFSLEEIPTHEQYAMPASTQSLLDDAAFDVEGWISRKLAEQFGKAEATALVTGDGVGKPEGVLNGGLSSIESGASGVVDGEDILDLLFELPEAYANNGTLLWKRSTTRALRKEKGSDGHFLWAPGVDAKTAATYAGHSYREAVDMPAIAGGAKAVVFADFKQLYTLVDRKGITVLRDPFTNKPFILFYTTRRVGGQVVKAEAGRILTVKA